MNKILLALLAAAVLTTSQAEAGDKPRSGYYKPNHGHYYKPKRWKNNNSFNNNRVYNNKRVYNYNYKYENNNNGWYAFGGFLGGLALGGAVAGPGYGADPYVADPYIAPITPQQYCGTEWKRRWNDAYQTWENIPETVCWSQ